MRVGLIQCSPVLGDVAGNLERCLGFLAEAHGEGCDLVVFPECTLSGYMFTDRVDAEAAAVRVDGEQIQQLLEACRRLQLHCVIGVLAVENAQLWNTALLLGPDGLIGRYDKTHIPPLGADSYVAAGQGPYQVHPTAIGRIGLQICYDWRFPEVTRTLALAGAEVVVMPTCSPASSSELADYVPRTRAVENAVFFVMVNRIGPDGPADFLGRSQVVDPGGRVVVDAGDREGLVIADIDVSEARSKDREQGDGLFELAIMTDRRPDLYQL
jgi:predicted amidohydrolase